MQTVCPFNVLVKVIYTFIWLQGNAFVLAIEPLLCCRLVLNTRSTMYTRSTGTGLTTTGVAAFEVELQAYRETRSVARKHHLDSMGLPQITGMSTANAVVNPVL
jgi:hypothetical protein